MKNKLLFPAILVTGLMMLNFSVYQLFGQTDQIDAVKRQTTEYTCTMHPEYVQSHPGTCPLCGLKLVEKKVLAFGDMNQNNEMIEGVMPIPNDSAKMKNDREKMKCDSTKMKQRQMMGDSTTMKKGKMMSDSTSMMHNQKK